MSLSDTIADGTNTEQEYIDRECRAKLWQRVDDLQRCSVTLSVLIIRRKRAWSASHRIKAAPAIESARRNRKASPPCAGIRK